jgi:hypothetical protein
VEEVGMILKAVFQKTWLDHGIGRYQQKKDPESLGGRGTILSVFDLPNLVDILVLKGAYIDKLWVESA